MTIEGQIMQFRGFSKKTIEYLHNVRENNSKVWYEDHREDYKKYVRQPFEDLIEDLTPVMREIDPQIITQPSKCLSRIRRDSRYTKDKHLYRDSAWLVFHRPAEHMLEGPGFFAEIMREGARYGMGAFSYTPKEMASMRNYISENPDLFYAAASPVASSGLLVLGETYKRMPSGLSERAKQLGLEKWFIMKNFYISSPILSHEAFFAPEIAEEIAEKYRVIAPFYRLLIEIAQYKAPDEPLPPKNTVDSFEW
ncbi:MAG: DUF2461 domain-containing protein [Clostridia bacterium]|nr:DUF2461 domain-containing protein [Clostridia bacterium]MBQ6172005.1 DUF2461 domain-containing protein [Clostridia bacterium]